MFEKVITKEALLYFSQQLYSKISSTFANKSHTHIAEEVLLNDGRELEGVIKDIENKVSSIKSVVLTSIEGESYALNVDSNGVIYTTLTENGEDATQEIIINGFALTVDSVGRIITMKK